MRLVAEARVLWKLYSTQIMAVLAFLSALEGSFDLFKPFVPDWLMPWFVFLFAVAGIVARVIPQPAVIQEGVNKQFEADLKNDN